MSLRTQLFLFFTAVTCMAAAGGVHDSIFNNFLSDTFHLTAEQRGWLELPRELPGFLTALMSGVLCFLAVTRVAVVAALLFGLGLTGIALWGNSFSPMLVMMIVASAGMHLLQPAGTSIVLGLCDETNRGRRMGQAGAVGTAGTVLGTGLIWLFFDRAAPRYAAGFFLAATLGVVAAAVYAVMHMPHLHGPRQRLVVRQRFSLYYILELVAGARKQVFLTFGPWVLIKVYGAAATSIAGLLLTAAVLGIAFQPLAGLAIDRLGERRVMIFDGLGLAFVCIGYGYAIRWLGTPERALPIAGACYIADNLLFTLGSARSVYLSRLTKSPEELNATLALGVSVNHVASMTIPAAAGAIWVGFGYERVFAAAAVLAVGSALLALWVPARQKRSLTTAPTLPEPAQAEALAEKT
ncbi:MAG: MFS transporter [Candidatus Hydrogenedentes bacterium]|nr:MFS transporter [Candidatus Hydrogenedentota bacterium]